MRSGKLRNLPGFRSGQNSSTGFADDMMKQIDNYEPPMQHQVWRKICRCCNERYVVHMNTIRAPYKLTDMVDIEVKPQGSYKGGVKSIPKNIKECMKKVEADLTDCYPTLHWCIDYVQFKDYGVIFASTLVCDECNDTYKHYFSDEDGNYRDTLPDGYRWESNVRNHKNYV